MSDKEMRRRLFKEQEGICNLCQTKFDHERHLHLDHITARARGGSDDIGNRQLLCGSCNSIKGKKSMEEAIAIAKKRGIRVG